MTWFVASVLLLTALLFFPMSKLIWVMSVRRLQRKLQQALSEEELAGQMNRARFIALFVSLLFSLLFNYRFVGFPAM